MRSKDNNHKMGKIKIKMMMKMKKLMRKLRKERRIRRKKISKIVIIIILIMKRKIIIKIRSKRRRNQKKTANQIKTMNQKTIIMEIEQELQRLDRIRIRIRTKGHKVELISQLRTEMNRK